MWQYNHLQPNELMHYGKKGMKWGKRNIQSRATNTYKKNIFNT